MHYSIDENGNQVVGYSYDADGNLAERTVLGNNLTTTYTYDYQNRLTVTKNRTGSEDSSYTYDRNNNRKEMTVGNKITAYKYNKNDELLRTDTLNTDTEEIYLRARYYYL